MPVHPIAAVGFSRAADLYERGRPEAPPSAVAMLVQVLALSERSTVVELGAGTGKFSRLLAPHVGRYVAVKPLRSMRRHLRRRRSSFDAVADLAEKVPVRGTSVDAVTVAQPLHWFRIPEAMDEMHRILRPDGRVALVWNSRDESVPWMRRVSEILDRFDTGAPHHSGGEWKREWTRHPGFGALESAEFPFVQRTDREGFLARFMSYSSIAALPPDRRGEAEHALVELLDSDPATAGGPEIEIPYRCELFWSKRSGT